LGAGAVAETGSGVLVFRQHFFMPQSHRAHWGNEVAGAAGTGTACANASNALKKIAKAAFTKIIRATVAAEVSRRANLSAIEKVRRLTSVATPITSFPWLQPLRSF
jgi:hypothetical protein